MDERRNCGTCKYHKREKDESWICDCPESDNYTDWTDYECSCEEWEGRR